MTRQLDYVEIEFSHTEEEPYVRYGGMIRARRGAAQWFFPVRQIVVIGIGDGA